MVHPADAIEADAIRLNVKPKDYAAVGILEVTIE